MPRTPTLTNVRERAMELGVYFPLGALTRVREELADLSRPRLRNLVDDLIDRGQQRAQPWERRIRREADKVETHAKTAARDAERTAERTAKRTQKRATAAVDTVAPKLPRVAAPKDASELAITNYDSLTASEIVTELRGLTQTEVAKVYKYERANENRSTVLEAAESRFVALPIPTYDALTVDEINDRLGALPPDQLKVVRRYEENTKARKTVLDRIDSLLAA